MATLEEIRAARAAAQPPNNALAAIQAARAQAGPTNYNAGALAISRLNAELNGPTAPNPVVSAELDQQAARGVEQFGQRLADSEVEAAMTADARNNGAPSGMVYDSRYGQMVDTAALAEQDGFWKGDFNNKLMSLPFVGESMDSVAGALNEAVNDENPELAAEQMRQSRAYLQREHPVAALRGSLVTNAGTIPAAMLATPAVGAGGLIARTTTGFVPKLGQAAGIGAVAGGLEGAASGYGQADYGGRLQGAIDGAQSGALFGAGFSAAGQLTASMLGRAWGKVRNRQAPAAPTIDELADAKNAAYQAVDDAGDIVPAAEYDQMFDDINAALDDAGYYPGTDKQIPAILENVIRAAEGDVPITTLDRIRQGVWARVNDSSNTQKMLGSVIVEQIDNVMDRVGNSELMGAARAANARYRKAQALDAAWQRASDQTASTGSGGNILNKMRQAMTRIINDPRQARFFDESEIALMRNYVHGDALENIARKVGKLAPGGNGLMTALNLGAVAMNPAMMAITVGASGTKGLADRSAQRGYTNVRNSLATGNIPAKPTGAQLQPLGAMGLATVGVATQQGEGPTNARARATEIYQNGTTDPYEIRTILQNEGYL